LLFFHACACAFAGFAGIPFWNTPEYAARVAAENAATAAAKAEALAGAAPPEEPEPFWSGLATSAAQIKNALAPPVRTGKNDT
jgi:hypothetical protein